MGRKPIPTNLKRGNRLVTMVTDDELSVIEAAAADAESVSAWVRDTLLAACNGDIAGGTE